MVDKQRRSNPDDRSDNVEKLQANIHHTIENMEEAEDAMHSSSNEEQSQIEKKNERRKEAINGMREEIHDEHEHQERQDN